MTDDSRVLEALAEVRAGVPTRAPAHLLAAVLDSIESTGQRRQWLPKRRTGSANRFLSISAIGVVAVVVAAIVFVELSPRPTVLAPPGASAGPIVSSSPTSPATSSPISSDKSYGGNAVAGAFTATGSMLVGRERPTLTLLRDGRVLVAGGFPSEASRTSEIFDPVTGSFTPSGNLIHGRYLHAAILLADGRVLIVGGMRADANSADGSATATAEAEVWDPATNAFTPAGTLRTARNDPYVRLVGFDRVVVAGGSSWDGTDSHPVVTSELWDPPTLSFLDTAPDPLLGVEPYRAAQLSDGRSLVLTEDRAWVADQWAGTSSATGSPMTPRQDYTVTLTALSDDRVLLVGGRRADSEGEEVSIAEIWDPALASSLKQPPPYGRGVNTPPSV